MDLNLGDVKILIKAENFDKALKDAKSAFEYSENIRSDAWNNIEDAFNEFGYNLFTNDTGDIVDLDVVSGDLPDGQQAFFESIAESVESGSYVCLKREDKHWKFLFENRTVECYDGEMIFNERGITYERAMELLDTMVAEACVARSIRETIEHLLVQEFTPGELIHTFYFDKDDVDEVINEEEEEL